jgi:hypothetical protein
MHQKSWKIILFDIIILKKKMKEINMMNDKQTTWKTIFRIGAVSAFLQIAAVVGLFVAMILFGTKPETAVDFFTMYEINPHAALFSGDLFTLILIMLYIGTIPAIVLALKDSAPVLMLFSATLTFATVIGAIASESTFSLLHLAQKYLQASDPAVRSLYLAAGEAVIATDLWNTTAGYAGGIFLQGSGILYSLAMLKSESFRKGTAIAGLVGNGLDLIQHLFHLSFPTFAVSIRMVMGIFYIVWFPMLAFDFLRMARSTSIKKEQG